VIVAINADIPVTEVELPGPATTVPIAGLLLLHVPPGKPSVSVVVDPTHKFVDPVIEGGVVDTVTGCTAKQPPGNV